MHLNVGLMKLIAHIMERDEASQSGIIVIYPLFRICTVILCILLCSLSHNAVFTLMILIGELCTLAILPAQSISHILKSVFPAVLLAILITLPSIFLGSPSTMLNVTMKVMESVTVLAIVNETSDWKDITGSLQSLHIPGVVILTLDMTINFLVLLARFSNTMLEAVSLRAVGDVSWKDSQIGGILGTTYLKSQHMAEKTAEAMQCRGFAGEYQIYDKHALHWQDMLYLLLPAGMIILFIYTESLL